MIQDGLENSSGPESFDIGSMLERYAPQGEEYEIVLPHGERFWFRPLRSYSDLKRFERDAIHWYKSLPPRGSEQESKHPFNGILPVDTDAAIVAYTISGLSVRPKIEQRDALKMLSAPWLIRYFIKCIDEANRTIGSIYERKLLEDAKNESGETDGGEPSSPSPETPSEGTPTS